MCNAFGHIHAFHIFASRSSKCNVSIGHLLEITAMSTSSFRQILQPAVRTSLRLQPITSRSSRPTLAYSATTRKMTAQPHSPGEVISEPSRAEVGPSKGSLSAEMQSQVGKTRNFEEAVHKVGSKMENNPASVTSEVSPFIDERKDRPSNENK